MKLTKICYKAIYTRIYKEYSLYTMNIHIRIYISMSKMKKIFFDLVHSR